MLSVLVGNIKGGCGKTTIATHLASAFAAHGFTTMIGDCDRQRSSLNWLKRRPETAPAILGQDWSKAVSTPPPAIQRLVIDAPAAMRHKAVEDLIDIADIVIVPVLPSAFDQDATAYFLKKLAEVKKVRKHKRIVAVIGNRVRPNTKATQQLNDFFTGLGFPVVACLRDTQTYPAVAAAGLTMFDEKGKRARDYAQEWRPVLELAGLKGDPAVLDCATNPSGA